MNVCGPAVARAAPRRCTPSPTDLILVFDDIDLPLGTVRVRMKGSAGGHNGVRSVIEALGTDDIRRVKVGIGRPEHKAQVPDHVLSVFEPDELPAVEAVVAEAAAASSAASLSPLSLARSGRSPSRTPRARPERRSSRCQSCPRDRAAVR